MEGILKNIINGFSLEKVCYEDNNDKKVENVLKKLGYV
jgi:phosphosulfolactate synthase (CoM biosynthesis protein A)